MFNKKIAIVTSLFLCAFTSNVFASKVKTKTPIKHLVIFFQENETFDHYFGTYPFAQNNPGETPFHAKADTPKVNGFDPGLLNHNQNFNFITGKFVNPFRVAPGDVAAVWNQASIGNSYGTLQIAADQGLNDQFVFINALHSGPVIAQLVMSYVDGNTVTALWNYAQFFAMSDNFFSTQMTASTPNHIDLISGQTHGATATAMTYSVQGGPNPSTWWVGGTLLNDMSPLFENCPDIPAPFVSLAGRNVGDLLNAKGITWGYFAEGFASPCGTTYVGPDGQPQRLYLSHHQPFQYYQSTANPNHLRPTGKIGTTDQANHQYDLNDFLAAAEAGNLPAVSFVKSTRSDSHPIGQSNPFLEQIFLVTYINKLMALKEWKDMAIIITWDDAGGWYDHVMPPIINDSQLNAQHLVPPPGPFSGDAIINNDTFTNGFNLMTGEGSGLAGTNPPLGGYKGRFAYGGRVPFLLISPWARVNYVDSRVLDFTSILRFIEDNWNLGRIGDSSFDALAGDLTGMFDFSKRNLRYLFLNPDGTVKYESHQHQ
jgi:phospholipase C